MNPENLGNISDLEGWDLTLVAYKKSAAYCSLLWSNCKHVELLKRVHVYKQQWYAPIIPFSQRITYLQGQFSEFSHLTSDFRPQLKWILEGTVLVVIPYLLGRYGQKNVKRVAFREKDKKSRLAMYLEVRQAFWTLNTLYWERVRVEPIHSSVFIIYWTDFTYCSSISIVHFEQLNAGWEGLWCDI